MQFQKKQPKIVVVRLKKNKELKFICGFDWRVLMMGLDGLRYLRISESMKHQIISWFCWCQRLMTTSYHQGTDGWSDLQVLFAFIRDYLLIKLQQKRKKKKKVSWGLRKVSSHHRGLAAAAAFATSLRCTEAEAAALWIRASSRLTVCTESDEALWCRIHVRESDDSRRNRARAERTNRRLAGWQKESVGGGVTGGGCEQVRKQWGRRRKGWARQNQGTQRVGPPPWGSGPKVPARRAWKR